MVNVKRVTQVRSQMEVPYTWRSVGNTLGNSAPESAEERRPASPQPTVSQPLPKCPLEDANLQPPD